MMFVALAQIEHATSDCMRIDNTIRKYKIYKLKFLSIFVVQIVRDKYLTLDPIYGAEKKRTRR